MAEAAGGRVKTFTIGFAGHTDYDERAHARVVAERFSTEHTEFVVEPKALDLVDRLVWHHDGPFGDSSAVPTYLLSELTRTKVTVALNGDGGDEVFAGYLRLYGGALSERVPRAAFRALGGLLGLLPEPADRKHPLRFAKRFAEAGSLPLLERYLRWNAYFTSDLPQMLKPELAASLDRERLLHSFRASFAAGEGSTLARLLQLNFETYLLDDLLVKMDRMSMAHGLEARSPFLDTAVVEFGASLARPPADALRQGEDPAAPRDEGPAARVDHGPGQDGLRRAARGLVPERSRRLRARAAARPGEPDLRGAAAGPRGRAPGAPRGSQGRPVGADLGAAHARELAAAGEEAGGTARERARLAMASPARKPATYDDLLKLPDDRIGEIVDGELIYARPRPGGLTPECAFELSLDLGTAFRRGRGGPGGWLFLFEPELRLLDRHAGARSGRLAPRTAPVGARHARGDSRARLGVRDSLALDREARPREEAPGLRAPRRGPRMARQPLRRARSRCTAARGRAGCSRPPTPTTRSYARSRSTRSRSISCGSGARSGRRRPAEDTRPTALQSSATCGRTSDTTARAASRARVASACE